MATGANEFMGEDVSRLTARDLLLRQNMEIQTLKADCIKHEKTLEDFKKGEYKDLKDKVDTLIEQRFQNVGIWKTISGISVLLGIIATLIAIFMHTTLK